MNRSIQSYIDDKFNKIDGWCSSHLFEIISVCKKIQEESWSFEAPVAEIGVYHGKFFIGLILLSNLSAGHHAIDVFDMQEFNLDGAGKGDLFKFKGNLGQLGITEDQYRVVRCDSMQMTTKEISDIQNKVHGFSFFSVDGCHTIENTINDLRIAMRLTHPKGIIFIDDYYNADWPGVHEGVAKLYNNDSPNFVPLAYACNKLFLSHLSYHSVYLETLKASLTQAYPRSRVKSVKRYGYETITVKPDFSEPVRILG